MAHHMSTPEPEPTPGRSVLQRITLALIHVYRHLLSPLTPPSCRFTPTCSGYAKEAIEQHGGWLGGWMALNRIARCHPFHPGGVDPVPKANGPNCRHSHK